MVESSMEQQQQYFVVFKKQEGELEPAYSYVLESKLKNLQEQNAVELALPVVYAQTHSKEETDGYLAIYKQGETQ